MIRAYIRHGLRTLEQPVDPGAPLPEGTVWIDLLRPTDEERAYIAEALGVELPTREEMKEIEASSQLYTEGDTVYLTTPVIARADTPHPEQGELTFVLTPRYMLTIRYMDPRSVATFAIRTARQPELLASAEDALLGILDAVADRVADVLELVGGRIDALSRRVFTDTLDSHAARGRRKQSSDLQEVLRGVGRAGDLTHKVRDCLAGMDRLVAFLTSVSLGRLTKEQKFALKTLNRDLRSLSEHAGFLAQETSFVLDATLGLISIEQNNIIKIFTIAATVLMPPTMIASLYGMNFRHMPELDWQYGYLWALGVMVLAAVLPAWFFRRRGWV